jgi:hypothetical protein
MLFSAHKMLRYLAQKMNGCKRTGQRLSGMGMVLSILILLAACTSSESPGLGVTTAPTGLAETLPKPDFTSTLPVISSPQSPRSGWVIYRDPRYGYGLALPAAWRVNPTPQSGSFVTMTAYDPRFDPSTTSESLLLAKDSPKLEIIGFEHLDPNLSTREALEQRLDNVREQTMDEQAVEYGGKPGLILTRTLKTDPTLSWQLVIFRLRPDLAVMLSVYPNALLDSPTVQAILTSFSFAPQEQVTVPIQPPPEP